MKMVTSTWWYEFTDENSPYCGEEILVEVKSPVGEGRSYARAKVEELFPNEIVRCYGPVNPLEAEVLGLDTY